MKNNRIIYIIHTPTKCIEGAPIQHPCAKNTKGIIEIKKAFAPGLKDLDGFSHIILLYDFHLIKSYSLEIFPFLDKFSRGIFSTRAPKRPNKIGLSIVKLLKIENNKIYIENIDVIDRTPLLDIKLYIKEFDQPNRTKNGWLSGLANKSNVIKSDKRFN